MTSSTTPWSLLARLGVVLSLSACGGAVVTPGPSSDAATDVTPVVDAPTGCPLGNGTFCPRGQTCPSADGCNICACDLRGNLACTARACLDAGPAPCVLPNGTTCPAGQSCPAGDGCNRCFCGNDGTLACTGLACVDAGATGCASARDCRNGFEECYFPEASCAARGTCGPLTDCAMIAPYCGCDGVTFMDCPGRPTRPNRGRGACATTVDAGVRPDAAICNGAAIGPGGNYCAGPDDGPLPVECCFGWRCDPSTVACNALPPTCPAGYVASVNYGCWGPCVPRGNCATPN